MSHGVVKSANALVASNEVLIPVQTQYYALEGLKQLLETIEIVKERFNLNKLWQGNFYEHIVRTDESFSNIAEYILNNPVRKRIVKHWQEYELSKLLV